MTSLATPPVTPFSPFIARHALTPWRRRRRALWTALFTCAALLVVACDPAIKTPNPPEMDAGVLTPDRPDARPSTDTKPPADAGPDMSAAAIAPVAVSFLDRQASPCDDFYQFACGGWMRDNALKPGQVSATTYGIPNDEIWRVVIGVIDDAVKQRATSADPETITIGNFHQSCLDAAAQPESRMTLRTVMAPIDTVASPADLGRVTAELRKRGVHTFFRLYAGIDPGDSSKYLLTLDQGARRLPTRGHYFDTSPQAEKIRLEYRTHITKLATLLGVSIDADAVLRVETALAQGELTPAQKRNPVAIYNKMPATSLPGLASRFPFRAHFDALGIGAIDSVNVISPGAVKALEVALTTLPVEDLKHYMRWQTAEAKADLLDQAVLEQEFSFYDRILSGATSMPSRRNVCLGETRRRFSYVLSRRYIEKSFSPSARASAMTLVTAVRSAFQRRIESRTWLDQATRTAALAKLAAVGEKIGYPEGLPTITKVPPMRTLLEDDLEGNIAYYAGIVNALGRMVDRRMWLSDGAPINVVAFYNPPYNDINLPAGILHLPHFDARRSAAANFGAIGRTIGHELSHGFDDEGRRYDHSGSLRDWWTPAVATEFEKRAQCVSDQFGKFEALPGQFIDPALTLGENLADLGGMRFALDAYLASAQTMGKAETYQGFDDRQQFFIASAQTRCTNLAPELQGHLLRTDPHSPDKARVNLTMAQLPEFAEAFRCPAESKMRATPVCEIW